MKENLSITINGLEYVAKTEQKSEQYFLNRELLLSEEIENLRNEINDLELALSRSEFEVDNLIEENQELTERNSQLERVLSVIVHQASQLV